jgi:hypothetical protein
MLKFPQFFVRASICLMLAFCFSFFIADSVNAQSGITISPVRIEDLVNPGESLVKILKVTNSSPSSKTLYGFLKDFKSGNESGAPILIDPGSEEGSYLASWIDLPSEGVDFAPGEEKQISFTINVPADAGPGGYYGGVYFGTKPPRLNIDSEDKGAGIAIGQQSGALVLLQVKGDVLEEADIREFNTDKELYGTPFDVTFITRIENKGNVHVKPIGFITVTNMFGKEVISLPMNESGGNVLPQSIRRFEEKWSDQMGFGRYFVKLVLSYGTNVSLGGQGKTTLEAGKYLWIMPWRIIVPALLSIIIVLSIFILMIRLYKNKAVRKAMQQAGFGQVKMVKRYKGSSPTMHLFLIIITLMILIFLLMTVFYFFFFA